MEELIIGGVVAFSVLCFLFYSLNKISKSVTNISVGDIYTNGKYSIKITKVDKQEIEFVYVKINQEYFYNEMATVHKANIFYLLDNNYIKTEK